MKKIVSLLMVILLLCCGCSAAIAEGFDAEAFARKFANQSLRLEPVTLPGVPEGVQWLSGSPTGRYLIGLTEDAMILYDRAAQSCAPVQFDMSGDVNGKLQWALEHPRYLPGCTFVWSPDERYFTAFNWDQVMIYISLRGDLLLGDTETMTISVKRSWSGAKLSAEDMGVVYDACFSPDSRILYFSVISNAYGQDGVEYMTMAYDIAADTVTRLAMNRDKTPGSEFEADYPGMACMKDGSIVQLATARLGAGAWKLRRLTPEGDGWRSTLHDIPGNSSGRHYLFVGPDGVLVLNPPLPAVQLTGGSAQWEEFAAAAEEAGYGKVLQMAVTADGAMAEVRRCDAVNACFSPDGRFILTVTGDSVSWSLTVHDTATGAQCPVDVSALETRKAFAYLAGRNAMASSFPAGMMWCGDLLLLGTEDGAALFRFAD